MYARSRSESNVGRGDGAEGRGEGALERGVGGERRPEPEAMTVAMSKECELSQE